MPTSSDSLPPRVLLVSAQGKWTGLLRLPYLLDRAGATVSMFGPADSRLRRSRFFHKIYAAPASTPAFIAALREHLVRHTYTWVIIGDDPTLVAIAQSAAKDGGDWIDGWFPVDRTKCLEMIFSKSKFAEVCPQFDVPIPHSRICNSFEEVDRAAREIGFPVMLKTAIGSAGNGVLRIERMEDLSPAYKEFEHRLPLVVQEFVVGKIGSTQMFLDRGEVRYWMPSYKAMCFPEPFGPSCVREFLDEQGIRQMEPIVHAVARMTGFRGMCAVDWIQRADGTFALLEFNPRPTPLMLLGRFGGTDCSEAVGAFLQGGAVALRPNLVKPSRRMVYMFPQHPTRCLRYNEFSGLLHWLPFVSRKDIPWHEPVLLMADLWSLTQLGFRKLRKAVLGPAPKPAKPSAANAARNMHLVDDEMSDAEAAVTTGSGTFHA
jgi:hypothetical protein